MKKIEAVGWMVAGFLVARCAKKLHDKALAALVGEWQRGQNPAGWR